MNLLKLSFFLILTMSGRACGSEWLLNVSNQIISEQEGILPEKIAKQIKSENIDKEELEEYIKINKNSSNDIYRWQMLSILSFWHYKVSGDSSLMIDLHFDKDSSRCSGLAGFFIFDSSTKVEDFLKFMLYRYSFMQMTCLNKTRMPGGDEELFWLDAFYLSRKELTSEQRKVLSLLVRNIVFSTNQPKKEFLSNLEIRRAAGKLQKSRLLPFIEKCFEVKEQIMTNAQVKTGGEDFFEFELFVSTFKINKLNDSE